MNFILNVKVLTGMYFDNFKGLGKSEGDPVEFAIRSVEDCIDLFERDKANNNLPDEIVIPDFYTGYFLKKRYSTNSEVCEVRPDELYELCYTESEILKQIILHYNGMVLDIVQSEFKTPYKTNAFHHFYLNTCFGNQEVIVEITLGQFLINYRGIFVGTREELRYLFVTTLKNNPTLFNQSWHWARELLGESPEKMFEVIWGSRSVEA